MFSKSQVIDALAPVIEAERNGEDGFPIFQALALQHANLSPDETREVFRQAREAYLNLNEDAAFSTIIAAVNGLVYEEAVTESEGEAYPTEDEEEIDSSRIAFEEEVRNAVRATLQAHPEERVEVAYSFLNRKYTATEGEVRTALRVLDDALFDGGLEAAVKAAIEFLAHAERQQDTTTLSVEERIARLENIARGQGLL
jgi:hypothetical protein